MKKSILFLSIVLCVLTRTAFAQEANTDSSKNLEEVTVRAFEQNRSVLNSTAPVKLIDHITGNYFNPGTLVNAMNSVAGVRVEERSPGSYRINVRGSSLRSPFGVRNMKVYWNGIPISDPGGNTYFNQFAWNNFSRMELFKGPAGSMYGAGTGGLLLLENGERFQPGAEITYSGGTYNMMHLDAAARWGNGDNRNQLTYAHNATDGYRVQTNMHRDNASWFSDFRLSPKQQITASFLFSDLYYQTPGALTLAEFRANPKAARPAGGGFPSAVNAHASIYQKNVLAGFTDKISISDAISNTTTFYGAYAQVNNSAIRNYERRIEPHAGGRSVFSWNKSSNDTHWQWVAGAEFQQGWFNTQVSKNKNGNPDTLQTNDDVLNSSFNVFLQGDVQTKNNWFVTAGISSTQTKVSITRLNKYPVTEQKRTYRNELAPRLSVLKKINARISWLATVSKGFSPPTVAEVLPSTGVITTELEAENGWNYETTLRYHTHDSKFQLEATGFYFRLHQALVQRRDAGGSDYFTNAGGINQAGAEFHASYTYEHTNGFLDYAHFSSDVTLSHFRYDSFIKGTDDFSGKKVPSVPSQSISLLADLQFQKGFFLYIGYYGASRIYLNDANTASADPYHILDARIGWKTAFAKKLKLNVFAGAGNLLDEHYSLGNDINAAGGRYYNAAPARNYYAGISFQCLHQKH